MARNFQRRDRMSAISEINVTPLIDLAFALLIIFMITTPLLEQSIALELPLELQKPQSDATPEFKTISLDQQGNYYWEDQQVNERRLTELLAELAAQTDPPALNLRADARLPYQKVIALIDLIKQQNLSKISLDTQVK